MRYFKVLMATLSFVLSPALLSKEIVSEADDDREVLFNTGRSFYERGDYTEARRQFEQLVELSRKLLGPEHSETLTAMGWLAGMLGQEGRYSEARDLQEQVVKVRTRILGAEHPDTLKAMHNLASTLKETGDVSGAQHLFEKVVELREENRGTLPGTIEEAESLFGLGQIHHDAGRLDKARELFLAALEALEGQVESVDLSEDIKSRFRVDRQVGDNVCSAPRRPCGAGDDRAICIAH